MPELRRRAAFDPDMQKSKCEYCLSEFTDEELARLSQAIEAKSQAKAGTKPADGRATCKGYVCDSCGAEVVTEETTSATFCYYCHNPVLLTDRLTGEFKPNRIIPFSYDKEKAIESFLTWAENNANSCPKAFTALPSWKKSPACTFRTGWPTSRPMSIMPARASTGGSGGSATRNIPSIRNSRSSARAQSMSNNVHEVAMRKSTKA